MNMRNGFFDGVDWPLGRSEGDDEVRPWKVANAEGVREVASAGGGRPVNLAKRVRRYRRRVKMPRMDPRVLRRFENCSATETIAAKVKVSTVVNGIIWVASYRRSSTA